MLKTLFFTGMVCLASVMPCRSQAITDSLASDFRSFMAKNFSRYRTVNLFWETKWPHDYTFHLDGEDVEDRRKTDLHTIKFSMMIFRCRSLIWGFYIGLFK